MAKRFSAQLLIRKKQIIITMGFHLTPQRYTSQKEQTSPVLSTWMDMDSIMLVKIVGETGTE